MTASGVAELVLALTAAATFVNTVINSRRVRKVQKDIRVPDGTRNGNALGPEVHEIRQDLYELGILFGSHLVHHEAEEHPFPVALEDLTDKAEKITPPRRSRGRPDT